VSGIIVTLLGLAFIGVSQWIPPYIDSLLRQGVIDQITVTEKGMQSNDDTWRSWATNGPESDQSSAEWYEVHMWNLTNPTEFLNGSIPKFEAIGPFTYRSISRKFNFQWGYDGDGRKTVDYQTWKIWNVEKSRSCARCLHDQTPITTLNFPFFGLVGTLEEALKKVGGEKYLADILPLIYGKGWSDHSRMLVTKTPNELLWGYHDPVLDGIDAVIEMLKFVFPKILVNLTADVGFDGILGPNMTSQDWAAKHTKFDGIHTGEDYPEMLMNIYKSQGNTYMQCDGQPGWGSPAANRVRGTAGLQYHADVKKGSSLPTWVDSLYRSATIQNVNNATTTFKGMDLLRFTIPNSLLQNSTLNPDNAQYYMFGPSGAINISNCAPSSLPIFMTKPHFLGGSDYLFSMVDGMHPDPNLHDTYVDVEPITGIVMRVMRKLQVTMNLAPIPTSNGTWFPHVNDKILFPVLWLGDGGEATDDQASTFRKSVYFARDFSYYTLWAGFILGNVVVLVGMSLMYCAARRRATEPYIQIQHYK